jgi:hypothetical protein
MRDGIWNVIRTKTEIKGKSECKLWYKRRCQIEIEFIMNGFVMDER